MSNYKVAFSASPTFSSIIAVAGLAAAIAMPASAGVSAHQHVPQVRVLSQSSSASSVSMAPSVGYVGAHADAYAAFTKFYGEFSAAQKPLEPDFAKVLFDNLWDLYAA